MTICAAEKLALVIHSVGQPHGHADGEWYRIGDGDDAGGASDGASSDTQGGLQEVSGNDGINEDVPDVSIAELESFASAFASATNLRPLGT